MAAGDKYNPNIHKGGGSTKIRKDTDTYGYQDFLGKTSATKDALEKMGKGQSWWNEASEGKTWDADVASPPPATPAPPPSLTALAPPPPTAPSLTGLSQALETRLAGGNEITSGGTGPYRPGLGQRTPPSLAALLQGLRY